MREITDEKECRSEVVHKWSIPLDLLNEWKKGLKILEHLGELDQAKGPKFNKTV